MREKLMQRKINGRKIKAKCIAYRAKRKEKMEGKTNSDFAVPNGGGEKRGAGDSKKQGSERLCRTCISSPNMKWER